MILHSLKREFDGGVPFHYTFFEILNTNRIISQRSLSSLHSDESKSHEAICQMTFSPKFSNLCDYLCVLSSSIICLDSSEYAQKSGAQRCLRDNIVAGPSRLLKFSKFDVKPFPKVYCSAKRNISGLLSL